MSDVAGGPAPASTSNGRLVPVGLVVLLQIQKKKLNVVTPDGKVYRTTSLIEVESLKVGSGGVIAAIDGGWVLDRHHSGHPAEANEHRPHRVLSIGFTRHYKLIESEFGWAPLGAAGENIVVDTEERLHHEDVAKGFVIRTSGGELELDPPDVLNPCVPFSKFLLRDPGTPARRVVGAQRFLGAGMRGYSMGTSRVPDYATVEKGDLVLRRV
ncbi:MAG: hypothetical protein OXS29_05640 [bacterium]|nr:hypothetical protein [bacterium]MDE0290437.1 hypothetical protein [bacterium]MDE0437801.1 hypothetical protein [bacterium]